MEGEHRMASDADRRELADKVAALVKARFGGDYQSAFRHYDADADGTITRAELKKLLSDAGVGNLLTRSAWAKGIVGELDRNEDDAISWEEFEAVVQGGQG